MADVKALEHSTLIVPYEFLNKKFRISQKSIERELSRVGGVVADLEKILANPVVKVKEMGASVDNLLDKLNTLKRKAADSIGEETQAASIMKKRISHLKVAVDQNTDPDEMDQWRQTRIDRFIVDYLLRTGYYNTALRLAAHDNIEYMSNAQVFIKAKEVEDSLAVGQTERWTDWANENRSKLRRMKSNLELKIWRQEFVELIRKNDRLGAVKFARRHFSTLDADQWSSNLTPFMGLLAVKNGPGPVTKISRYNEMFAEDRWKFLVEEFRSENLRLYHLNQPVFSALLQCGMSAMKTPKCVSNSASAPSKINQTASSDKTSTKESSSIGLSAYEMTPSSMYQSITSTNNDSQSVSSSSDCPGDSAHSNNSTSTNKKSANRSRDCPLCTPLVSRLAAPLAMAHSSQSHLICAHSGEPVNDANPPLVLPNGMVYGMNTLLALADQNDGKIICPRTKQIFELKDAERVYVM